MVKINKTLLLFFVFFSTIIYCNEDLVDNFSKSTSVLLNRKYFTPQETFFLSEKYSNLTADTSKLKLLVSYYDSISELSDENLPIVKFPDFLFDKNEYENYTTNNSSKKTVEGSSKEEKKSIVYTIVIVTILVLFFSILFYVKRKEKKDILLKYGKDEGGKLLKGNLWIGMTKEQFILLRGNPDEKESIEVKNLVRETFYYWLDKNKRKYNTYIFEDSLLVKKIEK